MFYIRVTDRHILLRCAHMCVTHGSQGLRILLCAYFGAPLAEDRWEGRSGTKHNLQFRDSVDRVPYLCDSLDRGSESRESSPGQRSTVPDHHTTKLH